MHSFFNSIGIAGNFLFDNIARFASN